MPPLRLDRSDAGSGSQSWDNRGLRSGFLFPVLFNMFNHYRSDHFCLYFICHVSYKKQQPTFFYFGVFICHFLLNSLFLLYFVPPCCKLRGQVQLNSEYLGQVHVSVPWIYQQAVVLFRFYLLIFIYYLFSTRLQTLLIKFILIIIFVQF